MRFVMGIRGRPRLPALLPQGREFEHGAIETRRRIRQNALP